REQNPTRRIGLIYLQRDYIQLADRAIARARGQFSPKAIEFLRDAIRVYEEQFLATAEDLRVKRYHDRSLFFHQEAMRRLGSAGFSAYKGEPRAVPFSVSHALGGSFGGDPQPARPTTRWFARREDCDTWLAGEARKLLKLMVVQLVGEYIDRDSSEETYAP